MDRVYIFLIRNDIWIYMLCFLGLVWYVSEFVRGGRSLRRAMFGLERESSLRTRNSALVFILLFAGIAGVVFFVNFQIAPTIPIELLKPPTPTPDPFSMPLTAVPAGSPTSAQTPTAPIAPTVTLSGENLIASPAIATSALTDTTPLATVNPLVLPSSTPVVAGCSPTVNVIDPRDGDSLAGTISIFGSANIPAFAHYEIDIRGPQTNDRWASLLGRRINQRVEEGLLATADLTAWSPGPYELRLSTTNESGQLTNLCVVSVSLESP